MKRSDTLFRHKATLLYDTGASIREMVYAITQKLESHTIDLRHFADLGVCERVGAWIMNNDGETGEWGIFTEIVRIAGKEDIHFIVATDFAERDEEMYAYCLDELIYLHDEIEKIYKYIVKGKPLTELW